MPGFIPYVWRPGDRERYEQVAALVHTARLTAAVRKAAEDVGRPLPPL